MKHEEIERLASQHEQAFNRMVLAGCCVVLFLILLAGPFVYYWASSLVPVEYRDANFSLLGVGAYAVTVMTFIGCLSFLACNGE